MALYLDNVTDKQERAVIKRNGKPVAILTAYVEDKPDFGKYFGVFVGTETGEQRLKRVRRSTLEKNRLNKYAR